MCDWGARGEQQPRAKLDETQVREIKRLLADGTQQKEIAALFGVAPSTVSGIATGRMWGHVRLERGKRDQGENQARKRA